MTEKPQIQMLPGKVREQPAALTPRTESPSLTRQSESADQIVSTKAIEQRAQTVVGKVLDTVKAAPVSTQLLGAELMVFWFTHPHMNVVRGGLALALAATVWDRFKKRPEAKR